MDKTLIKMADDLHQASIDRLNKLFDELVPPTGKAESLAGEIVRAISRIGYRFVNDGDHLGISYGKETCNPAGRFLIDKTNNTIAVMVRVLWGIADEDAYERILGTLVIAVVEYIEEHPELRNQDTPDMYEYHDEYDVDDYGDDEEDKDCDYDDDNF